MPCKMKSILLYVLCQFEAMGVGTPQVVPNIGGFKDFCFGSGVHENAVVIEPKVRGYLPLSYGGLGGELEICDSHDVCLGIETYLLDSELREKHGISARKYILENYKWSDVVKELIEQIRVG